ncbi:MAG: transposase [Actinobacteria bacterium]|nr:transposase [Actinomycetota bacterium]
MSETRKYRKFTAAQKTEIVLASLRGNKTHAELCREHDIADSLLRKWREQFLAAGAERLQGETERSEADELRARVAKLERALGRKSRRHLAPGDLSATEAPASWAAPATGRCRSQRCLSTSSTGAHVRTVRDGRPPMGRWPSKSDSQRD